MHRQRHGHRSGGCEAHGMSPLLFNNINPADDPSKK
jgi:hypothetical protein